MTAYCDDASNSHLHCRPAGPSQTVLARCLPRRIKSILAPVHLPARKSVGWIFTLEYPVVTRFFTGLAGGGAGLPSGRPPAPWCAKTVAERDDIPDWMKQGAFFLSFRLRYQQGGEAFLDRVPEFVASWREKLGLPAVAMMCGWEKIG